MSDNIIKFRRPEKKPEPREQRPRAPWPRWIPFAGLLALAFLIFFAQRSGIFG